MANTIRLSGAASGMDTETMVKDLMKARRAPLDKLLQKKQTEEWRRDSYREMNALLLDLRNSAFDMKLQGTFSKAKVTSSNDSVVTARATGTATNSTSQITVTQLAEVSRSVSSTTISTDPAAKINPDGKLAAESAKFKTAPDTTNFTIRVYQQDGTFKDKTFSIDPANESLNDVLKKVNDSGIGVTLTYDSFADKVTMSTNYTGNNNPAGNEIEISGGTFLTGALSLPAATDNGKNAIFNLNGLDTERASNTFTINGMEYTLKNTGSTTVTSTSDVDAIYDSIKKFVDKYNEVIAKLNTETKEAKYRDYTPLLDEQKEAMSDKQIELWEEKAKSGLLRSDSILTSALTEMRRSLSSPVTGVTDTKFDTLSEIGITTGSYLEDGKLYINETKLKEAITQNGSKVMELFTKSSDSTVSTTKFNESGLGQRLYDQIVSSMGKITDKAGSVASLTDNSILGKSIDRMDDEIDRWQDRLSQIEDRYWRQFTAMEQAMNKANSQSSWLAQQFSS
jgi:flagellar hook-associated protein 2